MVKCVLVVLFEIFTIDKFFSVSYSFALTTLSIDKSSPASVTTTPPAAPAASAVPSASAASNVIDLRTTSGFQNIEGFWKCSDLEIYFRKKNENIFWKNIFFMSVDGGEKMGFRV